MLGNSTLGMSAQLAQERGQQQRRCRTVASHASLDKMLAGVDHNAPSVVVGGVDQFWPRRKT
jgi:hypothetical protein